MKREEREKDKKRRKEEKKKEENEGDLNKQRKGILAREQMEKSERERKVLGPVTRERSKVIWMFLKVRPYRQLSTIFSRKHAEDRKYLEGLGENIGASRKGVFIYSLVRITQRRRLYVK